MPTSVVRHLRVLALTALAFAHLACSDRTAARADTAAVSERDASTVERVADSTAGFALEGEGLLASDHPAAPITHLWAGQVCLAR